MFYNYDIDHLVLHCTAYETLLLYIIYISRILHEAFVYHYYMNHLVLHGICNSVVIRYD